jgi:hypothetical protein
MYFIIAEALGSKALDEAQCAALGKKITGGADIAGDVRLAHVYVRPAARGAELVLFVLADGLEAAEDFARFLTEGALNASELGLSLASCVATLFLPAAEAALEEDP